MFDIVKGQMLQQPRVNEKPQTSIPVYINRLLGSLLLTAVGDLFFCLSNQVSSVGTDHSGHRGRFLEGWVLLTAQNADALPNTSVKQTPSWLGARMFFENETKRPITLQTDVYSSSPLERKLSSPSAILPGA